MPPQIAAQQLQVGLLIYLDLSEGLDKYEWNITLVVFIGFGLMLVSLKLIVGATAPLRGASPVEPGSRQTALPIGKLFPGGS